jgi:hypothetical protein
MGLQVWMAKHSTHIEATVTTTFGAVQCGALGRLMGMFALDAVGISVSCAPPGLDPTLA